MHSDSPTDLKLDVRADRMRGEALEKARQVAAAKPKKASALCLQLESELESLL